MSEAAALRLASEVLEAFGGRTPDDPHVAEEVLDYVWGESRPQDFAVVATALLAGARTKEELVHVLREQSRSGVVPPEETEVGRPVARARPSDPRLRSSAAGAARSPGST